MKYIRTKDGKIYLINEKKTNDFYCVIDNNEEKYIPRDNWFDSAYTIEELCDAFWWENEDYKEPIFIPNYLLALDKFNAWKESDKALKTNLLDKITIYGSIYIKGKGWKHVAKMNEKGELELL